MYRYSGFLFLNLGINDIFSDIIFIRCWGMLGMENYLLFI